MFTLYFVAYCVLKSVLNKNFSETEEVCHYFVMWYSYCSILLKN